MSGFRGGTNEALRLLKHFIKHGLSAYGTDGNKPEVNGTSRLSPYLHFGHIGPLTVALAVQKSDAPKADKEAFLNQVITWRELAVNLVRFNPNYDNFELSMRKTIARCYTAKSSWSMQRPTIPSGMRRRCRWSIPAGHNYVRMYWGKKVLEWRPSPAQAYRIAVRLNDKYELEGRDPNG